MTLYHPPIDLDAKVFFVLEGKDYVKDEVVYSCRDCVHSWERWEGGGKEWDEERRFHNLYRCGNCKWIIEGEWCHPETPWHSYVPATLVFP